MSDHPNNLVTYGVAGASVLSVLLFWAARSSSPPDKSPEHIAEVDEKLNNEAFLAATLMRDLSKGGHRIHISDIKTLVRFAFVAGSGKPMDDREMLTEKLMAVVAKLPDSSRARKKLTDILVKGLWNNLDHPPISFHGPEYQYRKADGSHNNVLLPDLGKAGMPYAKSIIPKQPIQTQRPDPELLFDSLMARQPGTYKKNEAGLSVMLFYHATIIIHDIFRSNRYNPLVSDTSSYVDLAPLYGSSESDQQKVRTYQKGMLKPDTFFEERLLAQPPGVNVMLVLYSRFHNYCAEMLLKINEGGKFTLKPGDESEALKTQDEALFQTARLVTCGLYANIALHDYLRGLTNTHHSDSKWTLDPRGEIDKGHPLKAELARGCGNQVTTEFNLMYRFHAAISSRDEKWLEKFYEEELGIKDVETATPRDVLVGLAKYEHSIEPEPCKRVFGGLKRDASGKFSDADLARILKESIEDPAGAFGANNVPKALKAVEMLGIMRAREWQTASLNEFRDFFGLKRYSSFEEINPDPRVADLLRTMYDTPDMVEAYPTMWIEEAKPALNPGSGVCLPYTVGRAIFSDAITLVRSDRFYTIDFTPATLTSWGLNEVSADYDTLGGSVYYKLIQRGLPGWFPFNSLHVMQPFFTKETNRKIAKELGTLGDYTEADPKPPPVPKVVTKYKAALQILKDSQNFAVPGLNGFKEMGDGRDHSGFMLAGDEPRHISQRRLIEKLIYCSPDLDSLVFETSFQLADELIRNNLAYSGKVKGEERYQIDVIKNVAIPVLTNVLAKIFSLDLKSEENPEGTYDVASLYHDLLTTWTWLFANTDPARAWNRRREARKSSGRLREATKAYLKRNLPQPGNPGLLVAAHTWLFGAKKSSFVEGSLQWYGLQVAQRVVAALDGDLDKAADILTTVAVGGGGLPIGQFAECFSYLLGPTETAQASYREMANISLTNTKDADKKLAGYMYEAFRLSNGLQIVRIAKSNITVDGVAYKPGDFILIPVGKNGASMDAEAFSNPTTFNPSRPLDSYILFGAGQHECIGKPISNTLVIALLKATSGLQKLQVSEGAFRRVPVGLNELYLSANGADLERHPSSAKVTCAYYTRDIKKQAAPIYAVPVSWRPAPKPVDPATGKPKVGPLKPGTVEPHVCSTTLRPQDIATEIWHIDHETEHSTIIVENESGTSSIDSDEHHDSSYKHDHNSSTRVANSHTSTSKSHSFYSTKTTEDLDGSFEEMERRFGEKFEKIGKGRSHLDGHALLH